MKTKPKKTKAQTVRAELDHYGHVIISLMKRVNALENQRPAEEQPGKVVKLKHTLVFNVYRNADYVWTVEHASRIDANRNADNKRIACLEINFTEGEGL